MDLPSSGCVPIPPWNTFVCSPWMSGAACASSSGRPARNSLHSSFRARLMLGIVRRMLEQSAQPRVEQHRERPRLRPPKQILQRPARSASSSTISTNTDYVPTIHLFATTDNYSTRLGESLHRLMKRLYAVTNKRDHEAQIAKRFIRMQRARPRRPRTKTMAMQTATNYRRIRGSRTDRSTTTTVHLRLLVSDCVQLAAPRRLARLPTPHSPIQVLRLLLPVLYDRGHNITTFSCVSYGCTGCMPSQVERP
ncbi:hypothetical protein C8F01DRAFT_108549 [Mycena amicta]|nr:hypothetical protein C8F01DRAFT_108549 [Mycena amicta]